MIKPDHNTFALPNGSQLTSESWEAYTELYSPNRTVAKVILLRQMAEDAIEQLVALLDAIDGDCDLEDDTEDEAVDDVGCDPDTDREPNLGWTINGCMCSSYQGTDVEIDLQLIERLPVTRRVGRLAAA
ncbi:hypothetical protein ACETRX_22910 [Labrys portucalensis]|uniref:Uncharacterized protein n=1 Tax=Labrys neptuniae TaxID=376174 RepID=A0ABV6ZJZ0_9HYPH